VFDISFGEILLIGIVALVVLGRSACPPLPVPWVRWWRAPSALFQRQGRHPSAGQSERPGWPAQRHPGCRQQFQGADGSRSAGRAQEMAAQSAQLQQLSSEATAPLQEAARTIHGGLDLQAGSPG
jgi:sec-independent protein translocase protein TatB